jgi:hypothetical protein
MGLFDNDSATQVRIGMYYQICISCGVAFAMPEQLDKRLRESHADFFCPNGHAQQYTGKTEAEKLRDEKVRLQARLDQTESNRDYWRGQQEQTERRLRGTKAVVTRMKRRVAKGVCVCCSKKFKDLELHMKAEHPDWNPDKAAEALGAKSNV